MSTNQPNNQGLNQNYVYSINNVIHIDDDSFSKHVVVANNLIKTRESYNDPELVSQFRVIGGLWTDILNVNKILPHNDNQGYERNYLQVGDTNSIVYIQGKHIDVGNGQMVIYQDQNKLTLNEGSSAQLILDASEGSITLGKANETKDTHIYGENVYIGEPGKYTYILGNLVTFGEGAPNDPTTSASSFTIHNTGTRTALTVIQDNDAGNHNEDLAVFITSSNQDRAPLRIGANGALGMGLLREEEINAWCHINKNDYGVDTSIDLFLVEDQDNDTSPFVIKNNGDVAIGTKDPEYGFDVHTDSCLRGATYLKNPFNTIHKISYVLGGGLEELNSNENISGFTMSWNTPSISSIDNTHTFRVSCKFHISFDDGNIGYRRYEIFFDPTEDSSQPLINVAEVYDSVSNVIQMGRIVVKRTTNGNNESEIYVPWITLSGTQRQRYRNYIEIEVMCHSSLNFFVFNEKKYN